ncbi:MAG: response regulator [Spirochaetia bacterium]|jgi:two-component system response regulator YesN
MNIVIVEDEPRIREGLARVMGKIKPGYRVIGEARDGLEGMRVIRETRPDLVITDVRMPDLSGLEMLDRLRVQGLRVKSVVLSAFSEFSYAREAMKLGVREYLLKPINVRDLARALKNIEDQIENERLSERKVSFTLEGALYSIMIGGAHVDEDLLSSLSRDCGVETEGHFALATVYLGRSYATQGRRVVRIAEATLSAKTGFDWRIVEFPRNNRFSVFAFNVADVESLREWFGGRFLARMRESRIPELCLGWGRFHDLGELRAATLGIDESLDWNMALGVGTLIAWPEVERTRAAPLHYPVALENEVRAALCAVDRSRYETGIAEFMKHLRDGKVHSPREIKNSFIRFFWSVLNTAREIDYDGYAALTQQEILESIEFAVSWTEMEEAAKILLGLFPEREGASWNDGFPVARAKNIVQELYSHGITLKEVASQMAVTPEYLSSQFHRVTGTTFSSYIRDYRIRKAKELLIGTELKLYEVGDRVGYKDAKYFCRVFKEATGLKPSAFRKANR